MEERRKSVKFENEEWDRTFLPTPDVQFVGELDGTLRFTGAIEDPTERRFHQTGVAMIKELGRSSIHISLPDSIMAQSLSVVPSSDITHSHPSPLSFVSSLITDTLSNLTGIFDDDHTKEEWLVESTNNLIPSMELHPSDFEWRDVKSFDYTQHGYLSSATVTAFCMHPRLNRICIALRNAIIFFDGSTQTFIPMILRNEDYQSDVSDVCYSHTGHLLAVTSPSSKSILIWRLINLNDTNQNTSNDDSGIIYARVITDDNQPNRVMFSPCDSWIVTWKVHDSQLTIYNSSDMSDVVYQHRLKNGIIDIQFANHTRESLSSNHTKKSGVEYAQRQDSIQLLVLTEDRKLILVDTSVSSDWIKWVLPEKDGLYSMPVMHCYLHDTNHNGIFFIPDANRLYYLPLKRLSDWHKVMDLSWSHSSDHESIIYTVRDLVMSECGTRIAILYWKEMIDNNGHTVIERRLAEYIGLLSFDSDNGCIPLGLINCPPLMDDQDHVGTPLYVQFQSNLNHLNLVVLWSHGLIGYYPIKCQSSSTLR